MAIFIGLFVVSAVGFVMLGWRKLKAELDEARHHLALSEQAYAEERESSSGVVDTLTEKMERLENRIKDLDSECDRLSVENRMRREYAYVCDECKTHSPAVREARDRSLRSVTSGPKR